jgi:hypothetical protein
MSVLIKHLRYKMVRQKMLGFADLGFPFYVPKRRYLLAGRGRVSSP